MKDFIFAALPWILLGLSLAIFAVSFSAKHKRTADSGSDKEDDYGLPGMCLGLCIGMALGTVFGHTAMGMSPGMLLGMAIGMCIKKEKK